MEKDHLVGILCERDVLRRVICEGRRADDTRVREVMTRNPRTISAGQSLAAAMAEMIDGGFRHLPVTRDGRVVGMLSMRDIPTQYRLMFERFAEVRPATSGVERSIRATI